MKTTSSGAALGSSPASAGGRLNGKDFINIGIFTAIYFVIVFAVACLGFIPIFIVRAGGYANAKMSVLSHGVFSCWMIGNFLPMLLTADSYYATMRGQFGDAYVNELMGYLQPWAYPAMLIACFVTGIVGGFIGLKVLGKHFKRAGIA